MSGERALAGEEHATPLSQPYWDALNAGTFELQRCEDCARFQHYPRLLCKHCGKGQLSWGPPSRDGVVVAAVKTHRTSNALMHDRLPYCVILLRLADGPLLLGTAADELAVGDRATLDLDATRRSGLHTIASA